MADVQKNGLSEEALERIKFSFSSKNAENVVAPCLVDVYMAEDPRENSNTDIVWQLVTTGVVALLRNRESTKKGWMWNISVAIADRFHGMCVWRDRLSRESSYTIVSDTFHVFAVNDIQAITAFVFESAQHGRHFGDTYKQWVRDKLKEDGFKGKIQSGPRFRRDMISRPCNFQHISGSAALAQIQQMEDAKQAVGRVISTIGRLRAVSLDNIDGELSGGKRHKRKDHIQNEWPSRFEHMNIPAPVRQQQTSSSGLDLMYSQEPGSVQDNTSSVTMEATVAEQQQPIHSNGVSHNYNVESSSSIPQYHHQQQNGGQQINYTQQQYYEEGQHQNYQHSSYQQDQGAYQNHQQDQGAYQNYQQDQGAYQNHQQDQGAYQNHQQDQGAYQNHHQDQNHQAGQEMQQGVEDIGYDYDDMINEPAEHFWRESVMEGTNWEDEIMKAWTLHSGTEFSTTATSHS